MRRGDGKGSVYRHPRSKFCWLRYSGPRKNPDGSLGWGEIRESSGETDREKAERFLRKRVREVENHREGIRKFQGPAQERVTLDEILGRLEREYQLRQKKSVTQIRCYIKHVREHFGNARAADISTASVRDYISLRKSRGAANSTVNHEVSAISQAFSLALEDGIFLAPPKMPKGLEEESAIRYVRFSPEHADAVTKKFEERGEPDARDFWQWMRCSGGMRPGAISALQWPSFDKDEWTLSLPAKDDKSGYGRPIPLEGELREIIQRRLKARRPGVPWIFHRNGRRIRVDHFRKKLLYPVLRELGLPTGRKDGFVLYDLKRTGMHEVRSAGVPEDRAMRLSGHKTADTYRRYAFSDLDDLREELRKADAYRAQRSRKPISHT